MIQCDGFDLADSVCDAYDVCDVCRESRRSRRRMQENGGGSNRTQDAGRV